MIIPTNVDDLVLKVCEGKCSRYVTAQYSTAQYSTVQQSTEQYNTIRYSTVQYSTVQYSTVQYSTVKQYSSMTSINWCFPLSPISSGEPL